MPPVKSALRVAVKSYALWGTLLVVVCLPAFLFRFGTTRISPVRLDQFPHRDGSLTGTSAADGRRGLWSEVSIAGAPWVPAGGIVACRELGYLPAGTSVAYRAAGGTELSGAVRERPASAERIAMSATLALLAIVLLAAGTGISVSGVSRQALFAGATLTGLGFLSGGLLLEPTVSLVSSPAARNGLVLAWVAFPRHLAFYWLASFFSVFPADVTDRKVSRVSRGVLGLLALTQSVAVPLVQVPGLLERLPVAAQAVFLTVLRQNNRLIFAAGLSAALALVAIQVREFRRGALPAGTRRRAEVVGAGLLAGFGPPLVLALVQLASITLAGRQLIPSVAMALSFLPMLVVPAVFAYAMLAPRVLGVGLLVRKAIFLAFAERTVRIASFVPLAALGLLLYRKRESPLKEILADHPLLVAFAVLATVGGLRYGDRTRPFLARLFFRARGSSPRAVARIAEEIHQARDVADLADHLSTGVEQALGVEQAALFVRSESTGSFASPGRPLPSLDVSSPVLEAAEARSGPFRVDPDEGNDLWRGLSELDRHWLESTRTQLLVPLKGTGGRLLGVLAVGEKLSELPLDAEDEHFLAAAASSGALALENLLLRSTHPSSVGASRDKGDAAQASTGDAESALYCRRCTRILPPGTGSSCPDDETLLEPAPVPILLAGKYRFERRIGAGGMGVVYLARDLALARDGGDQDPAEPLRGKRPAPPARGPRRRSPRPLEPRPHLLVGDLARDADARSRVPLGRDPLGEDPARRRPPGPGRRLGRGARFGPRGDPRARRSPSRHQALERRVQRRGDSEAPRLRPRAAPRRRRCAAHGRDSDAGERRGLPRAATSNLSSASRVVGTVPYLSPEALQGHPPSPSFDLWGLSVTIYETVTGLNPFAASSAARTAERILSRPVPDPRTLRPSCPAPLAELLLSALARSASARPASARALREAMEEAGRGIPVAELLDGAGSNPGRPSDIELLRTPTVDP